LNHFILYQQVFVAYTSFATMLSGVHCSRQLTINFLAGYNLIIAFTSAVIITSLSFFDVWLSTIVQALQSTKTACPSLHRKKIFVYN